ncbi:uncharacterized protein [Spinacia oleracea]|uniref:Retrotransposon gag domain-containing protein n=1 Tax=Spinacia oleracea TaxID=3562 RepID=A0ABM3QX84_SPIOL|nr:uncharacterized protein LOC130462984 [Spinacia oleracea]
MNAPKEPKVKPPAIDAYDGTSDPDVHLLAYRHHMYVQGTTDATWCKYFPSILKRVASKWFEKLPTGTINTYAELEMLFSARFMAYKEEKKTSMHLGRIQQEKMNLCEAMFDVSIWNQDRFQTCLTGWRLMISSGDLRRGPLSSIW